MQNKTHLGLTSLRNKNHLPCSPHDPGREQSQSREFSFHTPLFYMTFKLGFFGERWSPRVAQLSGTRPARAGFGYRDTGPVVTLGTPPGPKCLPL